MELDYESGKKTLDNCLILLFDHCRDEREALLGRHLYECLRAYLAAFGWRRFVPDHDHARGERRQEHAARRGDNEEVSARRRLFEDFQERILSLTGDGAGNQN